MPRLLLLVGLPGSGKSTLARHLVAIAPDRMLISTDAIRAQLFGNEAIQGSWPLIWQEVERQFRQAVGSILRGHTAEAIYDATNAVRSHRRAVIALARQCGFVHLTALWLDVPLEVCLQRNRQRDRQVPDAVIERMYRRLSGAPPAVADGLDCVQHYVAFHAEQVRKTAPGDRQFLQPEGGSPSSPFLAQGEPLS